MSASWGQSPINRKGAPAGEKNLEQQLLALSPENPVGGGGGGGGAHYSVTSER